MRVSKIFMLGVVLSVSMAALGAEQNCTDLFSTPVQTQTSATQVDPAVARAMLESQQQRSLTDAEWRRQERQLPKPVSTDTSEPMQKSGYCDPRVRFAGALMAFGGTLQTCSCTVGAVATAPSGVGVVAGAICAAHGADTALTGYQQFRTCRPTQTMTSSTVEKMTGSHRIGEYADMTVGIISPATVLSKSPTFVRPIIEKPTIMGYTNHGLKSAKYHAGGGVNDAAILNTVKEPVKMIPQVDRGTIKYVGKDANVVLNSERKVVTTYPTTKAGKRYWFSFGNP